MPSDLHSFPTRRSSDLIVTYRPVYAQPFGDRSYYWRIGLQPVDEDAAAHIVRATLGVAELPRELAVTIAGKAEGNPFFLEEIRSEEHTSELQSHSDLVCPQIYTLSLHDALPI